MTADKRMPVGQVNVKVQANHIDELFPRPKKMSTWLLRSMEQLKLSYVLPICRGLWGKA